MKRLILILGVVFLFGCSSPADALVGPDGKSITVGTDHYWLLVQDHTITTTPKQCYILSLDDDVEVVAWRYIATVWTQVIPNPAMATTYSDSILVCPVGFSLPIYGQFDALTIKGTVTGGAVQVHWYK